MTAHSLFVAAALVSSAAAPTKAPKGPPKMLTTTPKAATLLSPTADAYAQGCDDALKKAKDLVARPKKTPKGKADPKLLELYDEVVDVMSNAGARSGLAKEVHPDQKFREACEACEQKLEAYNVELSLDRGLYDALSGIDASKLDPVASFCFAPYLRRGAHLRW
jgi:thimet oligopeptidase